MNGVINLTNKVKVNKIEIYQGEYEGFKFYKIKATLDNGISLSNKLTEFEYETLKKSYSQN